MNNENEFPFNPIIGEPSLEGEGRPVGINVGRICGNAAAPPPTDRLKALSIADLDVLIRYERDPRQMAMLTKEFNYRKNEIFGL